MRRLLAVSWEMPPMYGPRATQVARTLAALVPLGWQPTVVCLDPRRGGPNWRDGVDATPLPGVDVIRVKSPEEWMIVRALWRIAPGLRDRPDSKWVWIGRAVDAATKAASRSRFDGLVTFAQPWSDHLAGLRIHRRTPLRWVAHFSDPWVDSPYWRGPASRRAAAAKMEETVVRDADALVFVTNEAAELVMRKYPDAWRKKVSVVPHGFEVAPVRRNTKPADKVRGGPMRMVYTGRFYDGVRTPDALLRAIAKLNAGQPLAGSLELTFVGPFVTGFAGEAQSRGIDHLVRFMDKVPAAEARSIAADADVLLVIDALSQGPSPFLPSKLVDYLPLRKPMLGITPVDGASAALLTRLGASVVAPHDEEGIRTALRDLLRRWREGTLHVGAAFDSVAAEYDIARTTAAFSGVLARAFGAAS
jgi:hypothetical protein